MKIENVNLTASSIARRPLGESLEGIKAGKTQVYVDGKPTERSSGYYIECLAHDGDTIRIKLPLSAEKKIEEIQPLLDRGDILPIIFEELEISIYAWIDKKENRLVSGVTAKAKGFHLLNQADDDYLEI